MLDVQLSYPLGSSARIAIQAAYGEAQRYMLIAATCMLIVGVAAVSIWRDIRVSELKLVKGVVI